MHIYINSFWQSSKYRKYSINDPHPKIQDASKDLVVSLNPFLISNVTKLEDSAMLSLQVKMNEWKPICIIICLMYIFS